MTLPKGYGKPIGTDRSQRPPKNELSRLMVGPKLLKVPIYPIDVVQASFKLDSIRDLEFVELHPTEWDGSFVLGNKKTKKGLGFPMRNITSTELISEIKGTFRKKEDLMVKIFYKGSDNIDYWIIVNLEDKSVDEFIQTIQAARQKDLDWTRRSLILRTADGQSRTVNIYPLTPFLAEGEEIVWQNRITYPNLVKVSILEVFTSYRVLKYSYEQDAGIVILLPSIEDITVTNLRQSSRTLPEIGAYILSHQLSTSKNVGIVGDIAFVSGGKPFLTFSQISDPERLASSVRLMIQQTNMRIEGQAPPEGVREFPAQPSKTQRKGERVGDSVCKKCGMSNSVDSKFCNKCGSSLSIICPNCGNQNASDASFCNKCGSKLVR